MVKKVFALASVTALSGLMVSMVAAGCSSTITVPDIDGSTTADTGPVKDSSRPDTNEGDTSTAATCPTTDAIDTSGEPYKHPADPQVGACNDADLVAMEAVVKGNMLNALSDLVANVSATCKACAVTDASAAAWGPAVSNVSIDGMTTDIFNVGACVGIVSKMDACGKAYAEFDDCTNTACTDCADTARSACYTKAAGAACDPQRTAAITACGGTGPIQAYITQCANAGAGGCSSCAGTNKDIYYQFEEYIVQQCVHDPRLADGGLDGG